MTQLAVLFALVAGQAAETPPPATTPPPVLRMEGTTSAPSAQPAPAPAPAPASPAAPAVNDAPARGAPVFLTINANRKDVLLLRADDGETACTVPCNQLVPAGPKDQYYLGGKGLTNSNNFDLAEGIRGARLDVRAGTKAGKIAGIILTALGVQLFPSGILSMVSWGILQDPKVQAQIASSGQQQLISPTVTLVLAIVYLAVGGAALTSGVILWPTNGTTVKMTPMEPPAFPPSAAPPSVPEVPSAPTEAPPPPAGS
jgi:hypothetical protein